MLPRINTSVIPENKEKESKLKFITFLKIFSLVLLGVAANFFVLLYAIQFLKNLSAENLLVFTIFVIVSLTLTILDAFIVPNLIVLAGTTIMKTATPFVLFFSGLVPANILKEGEPSFYVLIASAVIFFLLTLKGLGAGKGILNNSVNIKFFLTAKPVLTKTVTGLLIFLSAIFYLAYFEWGYFTEAMGAKVSNAVFETTDPVLNVLVPGASVTQNSKDFFSKIAENELHKISAKSFDSGENDFNINLLTPSDRVALIEKTAVSLKTAAEKIPAIGPIQDDAKVEDVLYGVIKKYLTQIYNETGKVFFGVLVTVLIFFTIRTSIVVLYWLIELVAFIIFKLLLILGFAYISLEPTRKETVNI